MNKALAFSLIALTSIGCSSYDRKWQTARDDMTTAGDPFEGAWEGSWLSTESGHDGTLRCIVSRAESAAESASHQYNAHYQAVWNHVIRFEYEMPIEFRDVGGVYESSGSADLGTWGTYSYVGEVAGGQLNAKYKTESDKGTFELTRAKPSED